MRPEVQALIKSINKDFGFNAARPAVDLEDDYPMRFDTGSFALNAETGGGIPYGRLTSIAGMESACKSALLYHTFANAQKMKKKKVEWEKYSTKKNPVYKWVLCDPNDPEGVNLVCALNQSESHSYTNDWADTIGIDTNELIINYPKDMEEALDIAEKMQESGVVDLIGHDSYAAYVPRTIIGKEHDDDARMGLKQNRFAAYHGKVNGLNNKASREGVFPTTIIALNQIRDNMNYGGGEFVPGGHNVRHTNSIEIRVRKGDSILLPNKKQIGQTIKFKVHKNKTSAPMRTGEFDFYTGMGGPVPPGHIDNAKEIIQYAILHEVIGVSGSWYYFEGANLAQGEDKVVKALRENQKMYVAVKDKTLKAIVAVTEKTAKEIEKFEEEIEDDLDEIAPKKTTKYKKKGK